MAVIREHFGDGFGFRFASLESVALQAGLGFFQHQAGNVQGLLSLVVQQGVDVSDKMLQSRIEPKSSAQTAKQATGKGLPLARPVVFTQAERADPEVRRARNRISGFNGGVTFGGKGIVSADVLHRRNLGSISHSVLSFDLIFDSISLNAV